jgi:hypothetical protein
MVLEDQPPQDLGALDLQEMFETATFDFEPTPWYYD